MSAAQSRPSKDPPDGAVAFTASKVSRRCPGVQALSDIDLEGRAGEVLAICGANGAGKSTFARLLAGQEIPDKESIWVTGTDHDVRTPADAEPAGVLLMHQEPLVIDDFTAGDDVCLYELRARVQLRPWARQRVITDAATRDALDRVGLSRVSPRRLGRATRPGPAANACSDSCRCHRPPDPYPRRDDGLHGRGVHRERGRHGSGRARGRRVCGLRLPPDGQGVRALRQNRRLPQRPVGRGLDYVEDHYSRTHHTVNRRCFERASPSSVLGSGGRVTAATDRRPGQFAGPGGQLQGHRGGEARHLRSRRQCRSSVARAISGQHAPSPRHSGTAARRTVTACGWIPRVPHNARGSPHVTEDRRKKGFVVDVTNRENFSIVTMSRLSSLSRAGIQDRRAERRRTEETGANVQGQGSVAGAVGLASQRSARRGAGHARYELRPAARVYQGVGHGWCFTLTLGHDWDTFRRYHAHVSRHGD